MHDRDYDNNLNVGSERLVTKNLPAGTYRKAKISSVDVIKLNSKKLLQGVPIWDSQKNAINFFFSLGPFLSFFDLLMTQTPN